MVVLVTAVTSSTNEVQQLGPTQAKTPKLTTKARARPTHITSQVELEDQEVEEMKK